jgi:hypothetical protein
MAQLANSYTLVLRPNNAGVVPRLLWRTQKDGVAVEYTSEPAQSAWQRFEANVLSRLPMDREL